MQGESIQEKVIEILREFTETGAENITLQSSLTADLGLSSLDVIDLVLAFEDEFGIEVPDEDIMRLVTVGDVVGYLERQLNY